MGRRIDVRVMAFALRRGLTPAEVLTAAGKAFPHRDSAWRLALLEDAQAHNERKLARR
jgi:hypothetical protein